MTSEHTPSSSSPPPRLIVYSGDEEVHMSHSSPPSTASSTSFSNYSFPTSSHSSQTPHTGFPLPDRGQLDPRYSPIIEKRRLPSAHKHTHSAPEVVAAASSSYFPPPPQIHMRQMSAGVPVQYDHRQRQSPSIAVSPPAYVMGPPSMSRRPSGSSEHRPSVDMLAEFSLVEKRTPFVMSPMTLSPAPSPNHRRHHSSTHIPPVLLPRVTLHPHLTPGGGLEWDLRAVPARFAPDVVKPNNDHAVFPHTPSLTLSIPFIHGSHPIVVHAYDGVAVTAFEVRDAVYRELRRPLDGDSHLPLMITKLAERLGGGMDYQSADRRVYEVFETRCGESGTERRKGRKRVDLLMGRTRWMGIREVGPGLFVVNPPS